ncbi:hypothetical protein [Terriglobus roseus]|uniref:hypothetical protein n=1 Tax=Terriglobus roseus TaxID=392734 RepID=UPI00094405A1|nr:hypothetical protein [Terriglobus roseus]
MPETTLFDPLQAPGADQASKALAGTQSCITDTKPDQSINRGPKGIMGSVPVPSEHAGSPPTKIIIHSNKSSSGALRYHPIPVVIRGEAHPGRIPTEPPPALQIQLSSLVRQQPGPVIQISEAEQAAHSPATLVDPAPVLSRDDMGTDVSLAPPATKDLRMSLIEFKASSRGSNDRDVR